MFRTGLPQLAGQRPQPRAAQLVVAQATFHGSVMAAPGVKFAIVVAKFNSLITKGLLEGAMETFEHHGVSKDDVDVSRQALVPLPCVICICIGALCYTHRRLGHSPSSWM